MKSSNDIEAKDSEFRVNAIQKKDDESSSISHTNSIV